MNTVGVILAGGLSRRFGSPKAFAQIGNKYFYEYAVAALRPHCDEIVIVTRPELIERFPKELVRMSDIDAFMGLGPLAGIYSAMKGKPASRYLILPCDMPFINASVIERLLAHDQEEVVAVKTADNHHPLVSIWHRTVEDRLQQSLEKNRLSMMQFLKEVKISWVDGETLTNDTNTVLKNINREKDLERGEENECNGR